MLLFPKFFFVFVADGECLYVPSRCSYSLLLPIKVNMVDYVLP